MRHRFSRRMSNSSVCHQRISLLQSLVRFVRCRPAILQRLFTTGFNADPIRDEGIAYAMKCERLGVPVTMKGAASCPDNYV
jgi:hypothetical protein